MNIHGGFRQRNFERQGMEAETPQALSVIFNEFCFDAKNVGI